MAGYLVSGVVLFLRRKLGELPPLCRPRVETPSLVRGFPQDILIITRRIRGPQYTACIHPEVLFLCYIKALRVDWRVAGPLFDSWGARWPNAGESTMLAPGNEPVVPMQCEIRVLKGKQWHRFQVTRGVTLREALLDQGLSPYQGRFRKLNCRGLGVCGSCKVYQKENGQYWERRACQLKCFAPIEVKLP